MQHKEKTCAYCKRRKVTEPPSGLADLPICHVCEDEKWRTRIERARVLKEITHSALEKNASKA